MSEGWVSGKRRCPSFSQVNWRYPAMNFRMQLLLEDLMSIATEIASDMLQKGSGLKDTPAV